MRGFSVLLKIHKKSCPCVLLFFSGLLKIQTQNNMCGSSLVCSKTYIHLLHELFSPYLLSTSSLWAIQHSPFLFLLLKVRKLLRHELIFWSLVCLTFVYRISMCVFSLFCSNSIGTLSCGLLLLWSDQYH